MEPKTYRESFLASLVSLGAESYKENARVASLIEDKAQKTAGLAGFFLAAALAFIKKENLQADSPLGGMETLFLLTVAIVLLVVSTILCVLVVWVRAQVSPISLEMLMEVAQDTLRLSDDVLTSEIQLGNFWLQINTWNEITAGQRQILAIKVERLKQSQFFLVGAILTIAVALLEIMAKAVFLRSLEFWHL